MYAFIHPVQRKGDLYSPSNYHPIALIFYQLPTDQPRVKSNIGSVSVAELFLHVAAAVLSLVLCPVDFYGSVSVCASEAVLLCWLCRCSCLVIPHATRQVLF